MNCYNVATTRGRGAWEEAHDLGGARWSPTIGGRLRRQRGDEAIGTPQNHQQQRRARLQDMQKMRLDGRRVGGVGGLRAPRGRAYCTPTALKDEPRHCLDKKV